MRWFSVEVIIYEILATVTFGIIYAMMNTGAKYWKSVIVYGLICAIIKLIFCHTLSFSLFLLAFALYLGSGFLIMKVLERLVDYIDLVLFISIGTTLQLIIIWIINVLGIM